MCAKTLRDELAELDAKLRELLFHQETTQADKASLCLAGVNLAEIHRRHMPRWTPVNPATLPPRQPGQPYPQLPKGWLENWEEQKEVANA
ncbi:MAG: hypothetical protein AB9900_12530 [Humidesulfovibrio sp.]